MYTKLVDYKKLFILLVMLSLLSFSTSVIQAKSPYFTPMRWSADGKRVAIPINDIVEVHDASTNQILYVLKGHTDYITSVAWSPNNDLIATASNDQTIDIWNVSDGTFVKTLSGQNDSVTAITWSPDSKQLISSGFDSQPNLAIWDVPSGNIVSRHIAGTMVDAVFSPDGSKFAYINPLSVYVLNATNFEIIAKSADVSCCSNVLTDIVWSSNGKQLATGSENGLVTLWNAETAQQLTQFVANTYYKPNPNEITNLALSWVRDVRFSLDDNVLLSISGDGTLRQWDLLTSKNIQEQTIPSVAVATFSPYMGRLASLDVTMLEATNSPALHGLNSPSSFKVVVPFSTTEELLTIAQACGVQVNFKKSITTIQLHAFTAQVSALAEAQIPVGCKADLLAVADALMAKLQ